MSAHDVGLRGTANQTLSRLAELWRRRDLTECIASPAVLRLINIHNWPVQRGMFFGTGGIRRAIEYCRSKVHPWRIEADWAAGLTLMGLIASWLLHGGRSEVISGQTFQVSLDNAPETSDELLFALATTLDRLVMNSRHFWHQKEEPLRYTAITYPSQHLPRSARKVLYDGNERNLPAGCYTSRGAHSIRLRFDGRFTLDGQMFDSTADEPLIVTAPDRVDFVRV